MTHASEKDVQTACAIAAWHGITAQPSRDEQGRRTVILTCGPWTTEVTPNKLQQALSDYRAWRRDHEVRA